MDNRFDEIAAKLKKAGMDDESISVSIEVLLGEVADMPDEEREKWLDDKGGADGIAESIIKKYNAAKNKSKEKKQDIISLDDDMFSDEDAEAPDKAEDGAAELDGDGEDATDAEKPEDKKPDVESIIADIDDTAEISTSKADEYFNDDDEDVKVKQPVKKKPVKKPQDSQVRSKSGNTPAKKKKVSVKNMSTRAKTVYIIGLVILIPLLIAIVVAITVLFLALYAAVILLVIAFSVALVVIAAVGTALSLMAIIFGVIQLVQGAAAPIGIYEVGLGVVAGGITLGVSILLYNFIVRLAPFLFRKMFVLYKFLFRQLTRLLSFVKGACSKL